MDKFPPPYDALPEKLRQTIWNSYKGKTAQNPYLAWDLGFKGNHIQLSLEQLLKAMDASGRLRVIKEIHARCVILPQVWDQIKAIYQIWDYPGGNDVSQGFDCELYDQAGLRTLLRSDAAKGRFCEDGVSAHRPCDTFRELIKSGPGLHVCIMPPGHASSDVHGIHIDKWQVVCERKSDGKCDYSYFNTQFYEHMKDATPWYINKKILPNIKYTPALKPGEPKL
jgi:hypothetical protein